MCGIEPFATAQALLPVFLRSLRGASRRLDRRLVVMATDAPALEACRKQHTYCLPWFQRTCVHALRMPRY